MNKKYLFPILGATFAVVVWGASFVATKVALQDVSPVTVVWLRFAIGCLILGIAVLMRRQFALPPRRDLGYFALLGFLGITFHQWLQSTGLVTAQAITTAWIVATTPIFMALLGWFVLREKLTRLQVFGIFLAAAGVLMVVIKGDFSQLTTGNFATVGDILIMLSAPNWAVFSILSRRGLQTHPAARMMFFVMGFGWLFTSLLFFSGERITEIGSLTREGWSGVLFLGIFCSGLAYIFWYDALKVLPAGQTGSFLYLEPFVTVLVAGIVLNEPFILTTFISGLTILIGVWFVNRPSRRHNQSG